MCFGCYEEAGSPRVITPLTLRAAQLADRVYEFSCVGGNLHIVLDDWNLEDDDLEYCSRQIAAGGYSKQDSPEQLAVERECCDVFASLSEGGRASALAIQYGFLSVENSQTIS